MWLLQAAGESGGREVEGGRGQMAARAVGELPGRLSAPGGVLAEIWLMFCRLTRAGANGGMKRA